MFAIFAKKFKESARQADPRMFFNDISVKSEFLLQPLADFVADFVCERGRLDFHRAGSVDGDADAGDECVGEYFEGLARFLLDGDFAVDGVNCGDHFLDFLFGHHAGGEDEFFGAGGIDVASGEPFQRTRSRVSKLFTSVMPEFEDDAEHGHNERHERGDDLKNLFD